MKDNVLLWYNGLLGLYEVGNPQALSNSRSRYSDDFIDVLYTMEYDQLALCEKIKNRLNEARTLAQAS